MSIGVHDRYTHVLRSPTMDVSTGSTSSMTGTLHTEHGRPPSGHGPTSLTPGRRILSNTKSRRPSSGPLRRGEQTSHLGLSADHCQTPREGNTPHRLVGPRGLNTQNSATFHSRQTTCCCQNPAFTYAATRGSRTHAGQ